MTKITKDEDWDVFEGYEVVGFRLPKVGDTYLYRGHVTQCFTDHPEEPKLIIKKIEPDLPVLYVDPAIDNRDCEVCGYDTAYVPVGHSEADPTKNSLWVTVNPAGHHGYFYLDIEQALRHEGSGFRVQEYKPRKVS